VRRSVLSSGYEIMLVEEMHPFPKLWLEVQVPAPTLSAHTAYQSSYCRLAQVISEISRDSRILSFNLSQYYSSLCP
jgi:hypothetical protein